MPTASMARFARQGNRKGSADSPRATTQDRSNAPKQSRSPIPQPREDSNASKHSLQPEHAASSLAPPIRRSRSADAYSSSSVGSTVPPSVVTSGGGGGVGAMPTPLYTVSEDAARRKFLSFHRTRQQQQYDSSSSASAPRPRSRSTDNSASNSGPGTSPLQQKRVSVPPQPSGSSRSPSQELDEALLVPSSPRVWRRTSVNDLVDMILQLQVALTVAKKENVQLKLMRPTAVAQREISPDSVTVAPRVRDESRPRAVLHKSTQTKSNVNFHIASQRREADTGSSSFTTLSSVPLLPEMRKLTHDPHSLPAAAPVVESEEYRNHGDGIILQLESKRRAQLEKMLLQRTIQSTDAEAQRQRVEDELAVLRAASYLKDEELRRVAAERNELRAQVASLSDSILAAERDRDLARFAARKEGTLRLEVTQLRSKLDRQSEETAELHKLCDAQHRQLSQTHAELHFRELMDREAAERTALVTECLLDTSALLSVAVLKEIEQKRGGQTEAILDAM